MHQLMQGGEKGSSGVVTPQHKSPASWDGWVMQVVTRMLRIPSSSVQTSSIFRKGKHTHTHFSAGSQQQQKTRGFVNNIQLKVENAISYILIQVIHYNSSRFCHAPDMSCHLNVTAWETTVG
jgi:hypothetical protein